MSCLVTKETLEVLKSHIGRLHGQMGRKIISAIDPRNITFGGNMNPVIKKQLKIISAPQI